MSKRKLAILSLITFGMVACSTTQTAQVESAACIGQAVINAVTASATANGNTKLASAGAIASAGIGAFCTGLASDTPLTVQPQGVSVSTSTE